ncbi:MAG TPA: hypothetical protein VHX15_16570 [Frankiaceae bacterium]|jgi:hypothetical protein|nr:hypothetical protein [Frankiaceae bacterium]
MPREKGASSSLTLDKRSKIMIGVLAVVLVAAAAFFLLKKSGSSDNSASPSVKTPATSTSTSPKASAAPKVTPKLAPSPVVTADSTRDPFVPLVEEAAATAAASSSAGATASPSASASTAAPTEAPTTSAPAAGDHTVALVKITGTTASVTYNSVDKTVHAGDSLATGVTVVKINADSIFVSYSNKLYAIAPGQSVTF